MIISEFVPPTKFDTVLRTDLAEGIKSDFADLAVGCACEALCKDQPCKPHDLFICNSV